MGKFTKLAEIAALISVLAPLSGALADDTDVYARPASSSTASNPNVLIIIDNSANWAAANQGWPDGIKQGQAELRAVRTVASELNDKVSVGLMMFTSGTGANPDGGYVRFKVRPMNQTNKSGLAELIGYQTGCTDGANSLNGTPNCLFKNFNNSSEKVSAADTDYSAVMFEAFKYFGGYTSPEHARDDVQGSPWDTSHFGPFRYAGDPDAKSDPYAYTPSTDATRATYDPPVASSCAKSYVIFIGNGFPSQDSPSSLLSGVGGDITQLPLNDMYQTSLTTTTTDLVTTSPCGTYADVASCQTGAAATYGTQWDTYSCTLAASCSAGSITTWPLGTSACGAYATSAACVSALPGLFSGYTSYSCAATASTCSYNVATTAADNTVVADTGCIANNLANATNCTNYGNTNYPSYSGFTCTSIANCAGGSKKWKLTATTRIVTGQQFDMTGTINNLSTTYSHNVYGTATRTRTSATPTGTFSTPTAAKIRYADEWARFLNRTDVSSIAGFQNVSTFTIDVYKDQPDPDQSALLISMARAGGGKYFVATDENAIANALRRIISEIQSVNSVFASSSLPASVNAQGTFLNQVFMGMFRPDGSAAPRWAGNLKQYKLGLFAGELRLADMTGSQAISATTGFITPCATSYWSSDTGTYWDYAATQAIGDCTAITSAFPVAGSPSLFSDSPDGEVVEKGGVAQHLRGVMSNGGTLISSSQRYAVCNTSATPPQTPENADCRNIYTCSGSSATSCTSLSSFDVGNTAITSTNLNLPVATERDNLINWVRGKDVDNENGNFDTATPPVPVTNEVRPSVHGGVVHAQPAAVDFGGSTGVVVFYGSDDALFHAVKGTQSTGGGTELWSFIAPEHYGQLNRQRDNGILTPRIDFAGTIGATAPKDYGFDGGVGVYQSSGNVWIFPTMRRGGRAVYAFDASTPTAPSIKWRKGCFTVDDSLCSTGYWSNIGQTWSKPIVTYLQGYVDASSNPKPVLVFGGGYDTCEDTNSQTRCAGSGGSKGDNIWIVDADTGAIIRTYDTHYSVPGDVALVTILSGGVHLVKHIYAADTGGYVYRIDVGSWNGTSFGGNWSVDNSSVNVHAPNNIAIASLSEAGQARKFLSGPAIGESPTFNAVLLGSGDRERPLYDNYACNSGTGGVTNRFYMLIDVPGESPAPSPAIATNASLVDVTTGSATLDSTTTPRPTITNLLNQSSNRGWRFNFSSCEQSVNRPILLGGITSFGTNKPIASTSACEANLGEARGYAVNFLTGNPREGTTSRSEIYTGGGMPPSPEAGEVEIDGTIYSFCIGCITYGRQRGPGESTEVETNPAGSRYRSYWYIESE